MTYQKCGGCRPMPRWYEADATPKYRQAYLRSTDLVDTLGDETSVTLDNVKEWREDEVYEWLEVYELEWDGEGWIGSEG